MYSGPSRSIVIGFALLASVGPWARGAAAQQAVVIEAAFPNQLVRGQTNVVHLAIPGRDLFQGAEVSPSAGVTVSGVTNVKKPELSQNVAWWDVTVDVAKDAAPGTRSLVLLTSMARTAPTTVVIPTHVPVISQLKVTPAPSMLVVDFAAADESNDLGDLPYVWFTIRCGGGEPTVGVVKGKRTGGTVRASIPRPAAGACDLQLRASDAQKIDSNTLNTRVL